MSELMIVDKNDVIRESQNRKTPQVKRPLEA